MFFLHMPKEWMFNQNDITEFILSNIQQIENIEFINFSCSYMF